MSSGAQQLTASSAFENTPKRSETNSETCPRRPRRIHIWRVEHPGWRTPFPDVCRREGRKTKPLRLRTQLASAARSRVCRSDDRVGRRQEHRKKKLENFTLSMGGSATMRSPPHYVNERVCDGSLLALCTLVFSRHILRHMAATKWIVKRCKHESRCMSVYTPLGESPQKVPGKCSR